MAGLRGLVDKARHFVGKNPDKARQGIDRAAGFADEKTGEKHSEKIGKGRQRAKEYVQGDQKRSGGRSSRP